jgi:hypothetical protein
MNRQEIEKYFELFSNSDPSCDGFERFLSANGVPEVFKRLENSDELNLNKVQLNQLLIMSGLTSISFGFFKYYWLTLPKSHPYNLAMLEFGTIEDDENNEEKLISYGGFDKNGIVKYFTETDESGDRHTKGSEIINIEHLRWGLLRIYADSLLFFGNISLGFNELNRKRGNELYDFFKSKQFDTNLIRERGHCMDFININEDDRYLISEAVCKNLDAEDITKTSLRSKLIERYKEANKIGLTKVKVGVLLDKKAIDKRFKDVKDVKKAKIDKELDYTMEDDVSTSDIIDTVITSFEDIDNIVESLFIRFKKARLAAIENTRLYLSLINDMDIYVATSMRSKDDFIKMANNCYEIFHDPDIKDMKLRYFDPTLSAAEGHDDKGLIECLMVQCAKVLLYTSGDKDSYGKDAEAAMALSSGKPVIFFCPDELRYNVSKNIHPLTKLIDFTTGVANGAMIAQNLSEVKECLKRIFQNNMQYMLTCEKIIIEPPSTTEKITKSYFKLKDIQTSSTVRVQTSDLFLSRSFWNYFSRNFNNKNIQPKQN